MYKEEKRHPGGTSQKRLGHYIWKVGEVAGKRYQLFVKGEGTQR